MPTTSQKMKFSIKNFFSKCDQIRRKLRIWSHLLRKSLMENFIFLCNGQCYFATNVVKLQFVITKKIPEELICLINLEA